MNRRWILLITSAIFCSCSVRTLKPAQLGEVVDILNQEECLDINTYRVQSAGINRSKVSVIDSMSAVFIAPSNSRLDEMKYELGIDKYEPWKEHLDLKIRDSKRTLDSLGIGYRDVANGYIRFSPYSGTEILLDTEMESVFLWKLFLFKPGKWPKSVDPLNISESNVLEYFELR